MLIPTWLLWYIDAVFLDQVQNDINLKKKKKDDKMKT